MSTFETNFKFSDQVTPLAEPSKPNWPQIDWIRCKLGRTIRFFQLSISRTAFSPWLTLIVQYFLLKACDEIFDLRERRINLRKKIAWENVSKISLRINSSVSTIAKMWVNYYTIPTVYKFTSHSLLTIDKSSRRFSSIMLAKIGRWWMKLFRMSRDTLGGCFGRICQRKLKTETFENVKVCKTWKLV